jgi:putative aminopeptidase FrvX
VTLAELSEARGLPGHEAEVRALIRAALPEDQYDVEVDALGSLYVTPRRRREGPLLVLTAHMDEVGFLVTGYDEDGGLRIRPSGSVDPRVVLGKAVLVGEEGLPGIVGAPPIHLQPKGEGVLDYDRLRVDIGAEDAAEAAHLAPPGSPVTFATTFRETEDCYIGKALDDRLGCYLLVDLLRHAPTAPCLAVFSAQEELGLRGATLAAQRVAPAAALAIEATPAADVGPEAREALTRQGGGPALTVLDRASLADERLRKLLVSAAERAGVRWQWRRGVGGANDAGAFWPTGVPSAAVSVPCRYIHGPAAVARKSDVEATGALLRELVTTVAEVGA